MYGHANPTMRTTEDNEQVGPRMHMAVVAANRKAWSSKNALAKHVGPNGSQDYGYRVVDRCINKGLICRPDPEHTEATPSGQGAIYATEKGKRYLENNE